MWINNKGGRHRGKKSFWEKLVRPSAAALLFICLLAEAVPVSADDTAYQTVTVTKGTMAVEAQMSASFEYSPIPVIFESGYGSTNFIRYTVNSNDFVNKGQEIAVISAGVDEIVLEEIKLRLKRMQESNEQAYADMQKRHEAAKKAVEESSGTQKQIAKLRLEQLEMEQERSRRSLEEGLAAIEKELASYEEAMETTQILAPEGGLIVGLNCRSGSKIWNETQVAVILSPQEPLYSVKDPSSVLRYGMRVNLKDGHDNLYAATVVSCGSKYLSGNFTEEKAILRPDQADAWGFNAVYENIHIENVLLISKEAVRNDKDGNYVVELKDGKLSKCYFTIGKTVNDLCYAIDGLTEGMTVVVH